jgi:Hydrogenase maturation factor
MAENGLDGDLIGVIFDGTGLGDDGTVWGGEFLVGGYGAVERAGHLKQVRLPGGDLAAREPWRMAAAWLWEPLGDGIWQLPGMPVLAATDRQLLQAVLERGINATAYLQAWGGCLMRLHSWWGAATRNSFDGQAGHGAGGVGRGRSRTRAAAVPLAAGDAVSA